METPTKPQVITKRIKKEVDSDVTDLTVDKENIANLTPIPISRRRKTPIKIEFEEKEEKIVFPKKGKKMTSEEWKNLPTEEETRAVHKELVKMYGKPFKRVSGDSTNACGRKKGILDACISVILSQNTSNANSTRASSSLRKKFPDLDKMREAETEEIEEAIRSGGLAKIKSQRIHQLIKDVHRDFGQTSLEHLRDKSTEEIKAALSKYKGMGPKTISCVLMFTLGRDDFPVDTHVHRVSTRLGWVGGPSPSREKTYEHLNAKIPDDIKYDLHVLLIKHGRHICDSQRPKCASCPVNHLCHYEDKTELVVKKELVLHKVSKVR